MIAPEPGAVVPPTEDEIEAILIYLSARPRSTGEIARKFGLTPAQIRLGLEPLQRAGALRRAPGGTWEEVAEPVAEPNPDPPAPEDPMPALSPREEPQMPPTRPPTLKCRALAWIRASPGVRQAALPALIGSAQSPVSAALRALERDGLIERRRIEGSAALAIWPVAPPTPEPPREGPAIPAPDPTADRAQFAALGALRPAPSSKPEEEPGQDRSTILPDPEDLSGDCDGIDSASAALSGYAARIQTLQAERAAAWDALGLPAGEDLPGAIRRLHTDLGRAWDLAEVRRQELAQIEDRAQEEFEDLGRERAAERRVAEDRAADLERQLRERTAERDATRTRCEDLDAQRVRDEEERRRICSALSLVWTSSVEEIEGRIGRGVQSLIATQESLASARTRIAKLEDAGRAAETEEPGWKGTRLVATREVELGRIRQEGETWAWDAETDEGPETGEAPTEARARARVEAAVRP